VKTNVLFFTRGKTDKATPRPCGSTTCEPTPPPSASAPPSPAPTSPSSRRPSGTTRYGKAKRKDQGEAGRFRRFARDDIAKRGDNLDISWLKDEGHTRAEDLPEPEEIAAEIIEKLQVAMAEMEALTKALRASA
jgi:type I restriction enzyme M protein